MQTNKLFVCLFFLIISFNAFSQLQVDRSYKEEYVPFSNYSMSPQEFSNFLKRFNDRAEQMKNDRIRKRIKLIDEQNKGNTEWLTRLDSLNLLMYNDSLTGYVRSVLDKIVQANPVLQGKEYIVFIKRSDIPNAANMGEGIVYVEMEILRKLSSESELAFVLAHELAHDYKNHVFMNMIETIALLTDADYNKELKKISKQTYNSREAYMEYMAKLTANRNKYSRADEFEADSLGLSFYKNAGYDPAIAPKTLLKLDSLDQPMFDTPLDYSIFSFTNMPFDETVLYENGNQQNWKGNLNYEIPDSLKTHPDCKIRAEMLEKIISTSTPSAKYTDKDLSRINNQVAFEIVLYYYKRGRYGESLFEAMSLHRLYPENTYLNCMITANLYQISESLKKHTFSKTVDFPQSEYTEAYNQLLRYLHQASYSELDKLARKYFVENIAPVTVADDHLTEYIQVLLKARDASTAQEKEKLKKEYNRKYPKSVYAFKF